eukprot:TRINITY_DN1729_c0_g1_i4.p2 TRINITY_DN1729_c0_g1~~TRINITY_DN1729_c0_g1_i4.p2  ORF type:complete len:106 (+),score=26.87 TRINITY_DN1729_c0_g1_i4:611-928(+)
MGELSKQIRGIIPPTTPIFSCVGSHTSKKIASLFGVPESNVIQPLIPIVDTLRETGFYREKDIALAFQAAEMHFIHCLMEKRDLTDVEKSSILSVVNRQSGSAHC